MNELIEYDVRRLEPKSAILVKGGLIALCLIVGFFLFLTMDFVLMVAFISIIFITVLIIRNYNMEYEYAWFDNELQVDKIVAKSHRRKGNTFDFNRLEVMAPVGHYELKRLENSKYRVINYSSNDPDAKVYSAYVMCKNEMVNLLFEPNEKMLKAIKYSNQRKVFIE